jgi:hypothetical protein
MSNLDPSRRRLVLALCCMSVFIAGIDVTIVNVEVPDARALVPAH